MLLWIARGIFIGALVGSVLLAAVGGMLGDLMGTLASLPSLGDPDLIRRETLRLASYGAVLGIITGSIIGCIIGAFGNIRAVIIGASVGAISIGLGAAVFGSITVNNNPVDWARVIMFSLIGAGIGVVAGVISGLIISPLDRYFLKRLQRSA